MDELRPRRLHLLGSAGHNGDVVGSPPVGGILFGVFVTNDRREHLHGRFAGGDMLQILRAA